MIYREEEFVDRCMCHEPTTLRCACCQRFRCSAHLHRELCGRCTEAVERKTSAQRSYALGVATMATVSFGLLAAGIMASVIIGLPVGAATGLVHWRSQRRRLIKRLRPSLAATVGELPPISREREVGNSGAQGGPPGTYG